MRIELDLRLASQPGGRGQKATRKIPKSSRYQQVDSRERQRATQGDQSLFQKESGHEAVLIVTVTTWPAVRLTEDALRLAIDGAVAVFKKFHRCQEIRYLHSGVQQLDKLSGSDASAVGYAQQFHDSAFHNLRLGLCGLSSIVHCTLIGIMHL